MNDIIEHARLLLGKRQPEEALGALRAEVERGNALAARELGLWFLQGAGVGRDLAASRSCFEQGATLGDAVSATVVRAFLAQGTGGPADWPKVLALLDEAAASDPEARRQRTLIGAMQLGSDGAPLEGLDGVTLNEDPLVMRFPSFLSSAECDYLASVAEPMMRPSVIVDPHSGRQVANPIRTSHGAAFPFVDENPAINAINRRIAAASGSDVRCGEPLQVLRYAPGQEYRLHSDALPGCPPAQQRVTTFLIWLNDDYLGGETEFPQVRLKLRGRKGDGLLFRNAAPDGAPDMRAAHAGLPVTAGVKMLASRWIRATPLIY